MGMRIGDDCIIAIESHEHMMVGLAFVSRVSFKDGKMPREFKML